MTATEPGRRTTVYMPLGEIPAADRNPKDHVLPEIKQSLRRFGYADTALLDERTGRLVGGHGRIEAMMEMHRDGEDPPKYVDVSEDGSWVVPVQRGWESVDDRHAEAMGVALNLLTVRGGWNPDLMGDVLDDLLAEPAGLTGTGVTDDLLAELGVLARADGSFLDGLLGDGDIANSIHGETNAIGIDSVDFRLPMAKADRDEMTLLLRQHQRTLEAGSLSETLMEILRTWHK